MRNDVKLGFAIGGVLLAVLIVYVLVVPGGGGAAKKSQQSSAAGKGDGTGRTAGKGSVALEPITPPAGKPLAQVPPPAAPPQEFNPGGSAAVASGAGNSTAAGSNTGATDTHGPPLARNDAGQQTNLQGNTPPAPQTDPFKDPARGGGDTATPAAGGESATARATGKSSAPDWSKILNDQPVMIAETPVDVGSVKGKTPPAPAIAAQSEKAAEPPVTTEPPQQVAGVLEQQAVPTSPRSTDGGSAAQPQQPAPPATAGNVHVVAAGETFSSISIAAYGSPNFYPAIMRANPNIDPTRLRPGMKITLPDASQVKPAGGSQAAARAGAAATGTNGGSIGDAAQSASARTAAAPIDPTKQYRVQPGDSLYKIAVKLYGKSSYVGKIHEANKETLGSDEHPLIKPGQVLTLPEPPTQQQQSAGQPQAAAAGR